MVSNSHTLPSSLLILLSSFFSPHSSLLILHFSVVSHHESFTSHHYLCRALQPLEGVAVLKISPPLKALADAVEALVGAVYIDSKVVPLTPWVNHIPSFEQSTHTSYSRMLFSDFIPHHLQLS